jgi:hypothetical protein
MWGLRAYPTHRRPRGATTAVSTYESGAHAGARRETATGRVRALAYTVPIHRQT